MGCSDYAPTVAMAAVQVGFAGLNVVSKLAMDSGMSPYVATTYRQIVAVVFLLPLAFFFERKKGIRFSPPVLLNIFLCSLFGTTLNPLLYFVGLKYTTPTVACALNNMLPAITFIIAIPFRLETAEMRSRAGQAKVIGTVLCVGGSMLMTFYKGSLVNLSPSHIHWKYAEQMTAAGTKGSGGDNMILGAVFVIGSCFASAIWYVLQAKLSETISAPYTTTSIMCSMATLECFIIGFSVERHIHRWALGWDIRLAAVLYTGVVGSGFAVSLTAWCVEKRGPLFVSMFSPLLLVIVAVVGWAILDEKLHAGSVAGSVLIVGGLYMVLWGKEKEVKIGENPADEENGEGGGKGVSSLSIYSDEKKKELP